VLLQLRGLARDELLARLHQRRAPEADPVPDPDADPDLDLALEAALHAARLLAGSAE
jgi:hypothetical protein